MIFSEIFNKYWPAKAIRVRVGNCETYMGINGIGLEWFKPERIKWLDAHKIIRYRVTKKEVTLTYRKSETYRKIVWGDIDFSIFKVL